MFPAKRERSGAAQPPHRDEIIAEHLEAIMGDARGAGRAGVHDQQSTTGANLVDDLDPVRHRRAVIERLPRLREDGHLRAIVLIFFAAPRDDGLRQILDLRVRQLVYKLVQTGA